MQMAIFFHIVQHCRQDGTTSARQHQLSRRGGEGSQTVEEHQGLRDFVRTIEKETEVSTNYYYSVKSLGICSSLGYPESGWMGVRHAQRPTTKISYLLLPNPSPLSSDIWTNGNRFLVLRDYGNNVKLTVNDALRFNSVYRTFHFP